MAQNPNPSNRRQQAKDWFEKNPSKTQFYLTIAVLFVTIIFSYLSLRETRKQYDIAKGTLRSANDQLGFAKGQYAAQIRQHKIDSIENENKEQSQERKAKIDSIRIANNDLQQQKNNELQNQINTQQLKINRKQLAAIQLQAKVADDQFNFQKIQSSNQFEQNRPIFFIDSVRYNKAKSTYNPVLSFHVSNHGVRTPHIDSTVIASWNKNLKCSNVEKHLTNIDLKDASFITGLGVYQDCIDDPNTIYFLNIIYIDTYNGERIAKRRFFRYVIKSKKEVVTMGVSDYETIDFIKYLKLNEKKWGRLL
jgi:hypothetical protein